MELKSENYVEEIIGSEEQIAYKITDESMRIIIHALINMYSDPIGSVVRELTANGLDAVKEKNLKKQGLRVLDPEDKPNYWSDDDNVYLSVVDPDPLWGGEPAFIIKDLGNGLSHKRIVNVFSTFGQSTKRVDNQEIGGFGIGSKSAFTYTETFFIKTSFAGKQITYMASRANGSLVLDIVNSTNKEDELNSTEIIIPVKQKDIQSFVKASSKQLCYLDNIQTVGFDIIKPKCIYKNEHGQFNKYNDDNIRGLHAVMGGIAYDIPDIGVFNSHTNLALYFNIGDLDLVPSRESLMMTEHTKKKVTDKLTALREVAIEYHEESMKVENTPSEFMDIVYDSIINGSRRKTAYYEDVDSISDLFYCVYDLKTKTDTLNICGKDLKPGEFLDYISPLHIRAYTTSNYKQRNQKNGIVSSIVTAREIIRRSKLLTILMCKDSTTYNRKKIEHIAIPTANQATHYYLLIDNDSFNYTTPPTQSINLEEDLYKECYKLFQSYVTSKANIIDLDAYVVPKVKRTYVRSGIAYKKLHFTWDGEASFSMEVATTEEDLAKTIQKYDNVIYGFAEDDAYLRAVGCMLYAKDRERNLPTLIVKISKDLEDLFINAKYVTELFIMKDPILINWATAARIKQYIDTLYIGKQMVEFNPLLSKWSAELLEFNTNYYYKIPNMESALLQLLYEDKYVDSKVLHKLNYIQRYLQDLDFLSTFEYISRSWGTESTYRKSDKDFEIMNKVIAILLMHHGKPIHNTKYDYLRQETKLIVPDIQQVSEDVKEEETEIITL